MEKGLLLSPMELAVNELLTAMKKLIKRFLPSGFQRFLRRRSITARHQAFKHEIVCVRYGDATLKIELVDEKGKSWYGSDRKFEPELDLLQGHGLRLGAKVFDLGAHQGVVALALAHMVGAEGRVVALEANPFDAAAAETNRQLNECNQLTVLHAAIAEKSGTIEFMDSGRVGYGDPTQPVKHVRAVTIDELVKSFGLPDVLFIDVDGFEIKAMRSASVALAGRPACYVEVHSELLPRYGDQAADILEFFPLDQYQVLVSHELTPSRRVFNPLDVKRHDFSRGFHLLAFPRDSKV